MRQPRPKVSSLHIIADALTEGVKELRKIREELDDRPDVTTE
ncbi:MAG: hypothetical protein ABEK04_03430 [Candidatus Nanohalobium sp.]